MNQPSAILERRFNSLVGNIHSGNCVLVLGPRITVPAEIAGSDGVPMDEYLSARLLEDLGGEASAAGGLRAAVARYEKQRSASACRSLMQGLVSDFDQQTTDLHRNLATLPFRLILSATPDRMMLNALRALGKSGAQEACYNYCRAVSSETLLTLPSAERPIVYSLFGRHDHPDSMVLDDQNLLDYLVRIIKESPPLPDAVRATLRAPSTVFLFMGFGFTNWWLRLLLKVLEVIGVSNRGISLALEDNTSFDAVASGESRDFFESNGIYIQARDDWNALAKHLAGTFRAEAAANSPSSVPTAAGNESRPGRPLVFLSYASDDADRIEAMRTGLQLRGVSVWQDQKNLRCGQNWKDSIERVIGGVDYFVFVQTGNMDRRDLDKGGVYNWELEEALRRHGERRYGAVFILHVTIGTCQPHPHPVLAKLHHIAVDTDGGIGTLAATVLDAYAARNAGAGALA